MHEEDGGFKGIHPIPRGLRLAALQMMYKHIDAFLYLGAHEFRNSGRGTFCWEVDPVLGCVNAWR